LATPDPSPASAYLTTKEVAALLRVKERKVYDLAAAGEIPHRRITGKLLFPSAEINAWIEGDTVSSERPAILAGSHDPLLDWAVREAGTGLATLFDGSGNGLSRFAASDAALCGLHIPDTQGWNIQTVSALELSDCVLIEWAERQQGLILSPDVAAQVHEISDLNGLRVAVRQPGAGARALFDRLVTSVDLSRAEFLDPPARTETDAATAVATGEADAALGLQAAAAQYRLKFLPLIRERFDLLIDRRAYFTPPVQALLAFAQTPAFHAKAAALGGYDLCGAGTVRWLSA